MRYDAPVPSEIADKHTRSIVAKVLESAAKSRTLRLQYTDEDGKATVREVHPLRVFVSKDGSVCINTICLAKQEYRTFRADRVTRAILGAGNIE